MPLTFPADFSLSDTVKKYELKLRNFAFSKTISTTWLFDLIIVRRLCVSRVIFTIIGPMGHVVDIVCQRSKRSKKNLEPKKTVPEEEMSDCCCFGS